MLIIELFAIFSTLPTSCIRTIIRKRERRIMAQCGNHMPTGLFDHVQGIMVAKCSIRDKGDALDVLTNHLQEARDGLLDDTESG